MRLSEFANKKIINLYDGEIMGAAGDSDLLIDPADGRIVEIVLQSSSRLVAKGERHSISIPWEAVKKVGPEIIVVDTEGKNFFHR